MVADHLRQVPARALHDAVVGELRDGRLAEIGAVDDDEPVGSDRTDRSHEGARDRHVPRPV